MSLRQTLPPQTDAATQSISVDEVELGRSLLLSAKDLQADAGVNVTDLIAKIDSERLLDFRWRLIHDFDAAPLPSDAPNEVLNREDAGSICRFIVELIEHEVGGRWVR